MVTVASSLGSSHLRRLCPIEVRVPPTQWKWGCGGGVRTGLGWLPGGVGGIWAGHSGEIGSKKWLVLPECRAHITLCSLAHGILP